MQLNIITDLRSEGLAFEEDTQPSLAPPQWRSRVRPVPSVAQPGTAAPMASTTSGDNAPNPSDSGTGGADDASGGGDGSSNGGPQAAMLEALSRDALAAVERYDTVIRRLEDASLVEEVSRIRAEHAESLARIRAAAMDKGGRLQDESGTWGTVTSLASRAASVFGDGALLSVLRSGEEHDLKQYEKALERDDLDNDVVTMLRHRMIPQQERHLDALDRLREQRAS